MSPAVTTGPESVTKHPAYRDVAERTQLVTDFLELAQRLLHARHDPTTLGTGELPRLLESAAQVAAQLTGERHRTIAAPDVPLALALQHFFKDFRAVRLAEVSSGMELDPATRELCAALPERLKQQISTFVAELSKEAGLPVALSRELETQLIARGKLGELQLFSLDGSGDHHTLLSEHPIVSGSADLVSALALLRRSDFLVPGLLHYLQDLSDVPPIDRTPLARLDDVAAACSRLGVITSPDPFSHNLLAVDAATDLQALQRALPLTLANSAEFGASLHVLQEVLVDLVAVTAELDQDLKYQVDLGSRTGLLAWFQKRAGAFSVWLRRRELGTLGAELADCVMDVTGQVLALAEGEDRESVRRKASANFTGQVAREIGRLVSGIRADTLKAGLDGLIELSVLRTFLETKVAEAELKTRVSGGSTGLELKAKDFPDHVRLLAALTKRIAVYSELEKRLSIPGSDDVSNPEAPVVAEHDLLKGIRKSREELEAQAQHIVNQLAIQASARLDAQVVAPFGDYYQGVLVIANTVASERCGLGDSKMPELDLITWKAVLDAFDVSGAGDRQISHILSRLLQPAPLQSDGAEVTPATHVFSVSLSGIQVPKLLSEVGDRDRLELPLAGLREIFGPGTFSKLDAVDAIALDDFSLAADVRLTPEEASVLASPDFAFLRSEVEKYLSYRLTDLLKQRAQAQGILLGDDVELNVALTLKPVESNTAARAAA